MKKFLLFCIILLISPCVLAQEAFWGYDEENRELIIPPECDGSLEADELYELGMRLFNETGYARQGASYCLLAAAMDNHPEAQYQIAHMYHKGLLLPKSDLAAYKWATLGALNGNEDADKLGASIEQFLSIQDIEASTRSLESLLPTITESTKQRLQKEIEKQAQIKQSIKSIKAEIADLKKYGRIRKQTIQANKQSAEKLKEIISESVQASNIDTTPAISSSTIKERRDKTQRARKDESIYSQRDLDAIPMPAS